MKNTQFNCPPPCQQCGRCHFGECAKRTTSSAIRAGTVKFIAAIERAHQNAQHSKLHFGAALTALALVALGAGCTYARVADRDASYTRISLGGDYISHGISFELLSNGIAKVSTAGFDNANKDAFIAACKSLETIAAAIIKTGVAP